MGTYVSKFISDTDILQTIWPFSKQFESHDRTVLEKIAQENKKNFNSHLKWLLYESLFLTSFIFFFQPEALLQNRSFLTVSTPLLLIHGTSLILSYAGVIKSKERIDFIEKDKHISVHDGYLPEYNEDQILKIQKVDDLFRIMITEPETQIGPWFNNLEEILSFRRFVISRTGEKKVDILQKVYIHTISNTYYKTLFSEWNDTIKK